MKTLILVLYSVVLFLIFMSCSSDDAKEDNKPTLSLKFNMETGEDQMGGFAGNTLALYNDNVWSFGGENGYVTPGQYTNSAWKSANGINWQTISDNLMADARHSHSLTHFKNKLYIIGGENNDGNRLSDIHNTNDGLNWVNTFVNAPFGNITGHQTIVFNNKMYIIAGHIFTGNTKVWSSIDGDNWIEETANAFPARAGHKAVVFNGAMYVIGGETITGNRLNEIWTSTNGISWTLVPNNTSVFPPINGHTATVYNNKVWIIGGRTDTALYTNNIYCSSNLTDWEMYSNSSPVKPIFNHAALLYNNQIWVFGGYVETGLTGEIWSITEE